MLIATVQVMDKLKSHQLVIRMITPLTVWAVTKLLDAPPVKERLQKVDARTHLAKRSAAQSLRRAGRNAAKNGAWLAGGAVAIALGIGMITKASRPK